MELEKAQARLEAVLPRNTRAVLQRLSDHGMEPWAVGGCVRDALLGRQPQDWDITARGTPEEIQAAFPDCRRILTGEGHGTVTIIWEGEPFEITMFRREGDYDGRRPGIVLPAETIGQDLRRRDFTVNAMAYSPWLGLRDDHGGLEDLESGVIRAVGEPERRFQEDALRILRGLRFAACLGFQIEGETAKAMVTCRNGMECLSGERVWQELSRLLLGRKAGEASGRYGDVFTGLGEGWESFRLEPKIGEKLDGLPQNLPGRLAFFLQEGLGSGSSREVLQALRMPSGDRGRTLALMEQTGTIPEDRELPKWLARFPAGNQWADGRFALLWMERSTQELERLKKENLPLGTGQLLVGGRELASLGVQPGPEMGRLLKQLLAAVWQGEAPNRREELLALAQVLRQQQKKRE